MQTQSAVRPYALASGGVAVFIAAVLGCSSGAPDVGTGSGVIETTAQSTSALTAEDCMEGTLGGKDPICHRTGATTTPYTLITIATQACVNAHTEHDGDFLASVESGCECVPHGASCQGVDVGCCGGEECDAASSTCQSKAVPPPPTPPPAGGK